MSPDTRNTYGYALLTAGRYTEALGEFEAYARIAPREPNPWDSLGDAYLDLGAPENAVEFYSRAMAIHSTFGRNGRAYALAVRGRLDEAIAAGARVPHVQAILLARVGRYREASNIVQAGIAAAETGGHTSSAAQLDLIAALLAFERNDFQGAVRHCQSARQRLALLGPTFWGTRGLVPDSLAGTAEIYSGRLREARSRLAAQAGLYRPAVWVERWWHHLLSSEIAFAEGDAIRAEAACASGEPTCRILPCARSGIGRDEQPVAPGLPCPRRGGARRSCWGGPDIPKPPDVRP
jgi:tetratricopeptide (TPR) repeat protein